MVDKIVDDTRGEAIKAALLKAIPLHMSACIDGVSLVLELVQGTV